MNKKTTVFLSTAMAIAFAFSASSCSTLQTLSFKTNFAGGLDPTIGYTETLEYSVNYDTEYFEVSNEINKDVLSFTVKDSAVYTSVLTVMNGFPQNINSDLKDIKGNQNAFIYKLSTQLSLPLTYTVNGKTEEKTDTVNTETYFYYSSLSYAPIYSKTVADYTIPSYATQTASVSVLKSQSETVYNQKNYTVTTSSKSYESIEAAISDTAQAITNSKTYDYSYKTVIDNNELLFALRNVELEEEGYKYLPVVSYGYGEYKNLRVTNKSEFDGFDINVSVNGKNNVAEKIKVKEYTFAVESTKASGTAQLLFLQNGTSPNFDKNYSLPVRYVEPLTCYGSFLSFGALRYDLTKLTIG